MSDPYNPIYGQVPNIVRYQQEIQRKAQNGQYLSGIMQMKSVPNASSIVENIGGIVEMQEIPVTYTGNLTAVPITFTQISTGVIGLTLKTAISTLAAKTSVDQSLFVAHSDAHAMAAARAYDAVKVAAFLSLDVNGDPVLPPVSELIGPNTGLNVQKYAAFRSQLDRTGTDQGDSYVTFNSTFKQSLVLDPVISNFFFVNDKTVPTGQLAQVMGFDSKVIGSLSSGRVFQVVEAYTPPPTTAVPAPVSTQSIASYALFNKFEALAFYEFVPLQVQVWKDAGNAVWNFVTQMGIACNILQPEIAGVCKLYANASNNQPFPTA
jgi:hypothetical protein